MSDAEELGILARLPSYDAIAYMVGRYRKGSPTERRLGALRVTTNWQDMWHEEHAQAFTISRLTRQDLLAAIHQGLLESVRGDLTRTDWMKNTEELLAKAGWWGADRPVLDRRTGEELTTTFNPARLSLIYDTNTRHAYAAGQWQRIQAAKHTHPYLRYVTRDDARVRDEHRAWHNVTLHADDPWWNTHFPPNGWRCRCRVVPMSREDYERGVLEEKPQYHPGDSSSPIITRPLVTQAPSERTHTWRNPRSGKTEDVPEGIAPGFAYNVGKARATLAELERLIEQSDGRLPPNTLAAARQTLRIKPESAKELAGQDTWQTLGLPRLRDMEPQGDAPQLLPKAGSWQEATNTLRDALGVPPGGMRRFKLPAELGDVAVWEELLPHIPEKLENARERYALFIEPTLTAPDEIWETGYDDGTTRRRFIRIFRGEKYGFLLVAQQSADGSIMWNMMNREPRGMDKWRAGRLVYSREERGGD